MFNYYSQQKKEEEVKAQKREEKSELKWKMKRRGKV